MFLGVHGDACDLTKMHIEGQLQEVFDRNKLYLRGATLGNGGCAEQHTTGHQQRIKVSFHGAYFDQKLI
jgi:hypothetical protein